jgi:hypothetical protein
VLEAMRTFSALVCGVGGRLIPSAVLLVFQTAERGHKCAELGVFYEATLVVVTIRPAITMAFNSRDGSCMKGTDGDGVSVYEATAASGRMASFVRQRDTTVLRDAEFIPAGPQRTGWVIEAWFGNLPCVCGTSQVCMGEGEHGYACVCALLALTHHQNHLGTAAHWPAVKAHAKRSGTQSRCCASCI